MGHPLEMDPEAMRRAGYATVDAMVARLAAPAADPVLRRAGPAEMRARLGGPPPEEGRAFEAVLERVLTDVLPYASRTDHPGYLAFIPSFTTWPAALAELTAAAANPYCGAWMESAGPAQVELEVLDWFRTWLGLPEGTAGVMVSGGSTANLTALLVARHEVTSPADLGVLYVSDQAHSSLARTARAMGLDPSQVRVLPTDASWRLAPSTVVAAVRADRAAGRTPFALCASAGSTNTGTVDPLGDLADVCAAEGLWLHVDAAYGGFAMLSDKGRSLLAGIDRADSVTLDPHKWLFQPMECATVLVRDGRPSSVPSPSTPTTSTTATSTTAARSTSPTGGCRCPGASGPSRCGCRSRPSGWPPSAGQSSATWSWPSGLSSWWPSTRRCPSWPRPAWASCASGGSGRDTTRPRSRPGAGPWSSRSSATAGPWSRPPAWPAATPSGCASSTRRRARTTSAG